MESYSRILIISLGGAGDVLMMTPMLRHLHEVYPQVEVDVLTMQGAVACDVLRGNPCVHEHLHYDFMRASRASSLALCRRLRRRRYDVSFTVMPQNRLEYNLVTWLIGARVRIGFDFMIHCGAGGRPFLTKRISERKEHLVENNIRLLIEGLGVPSRGVPGDLELSISEESFRFAEQFLTVQNLTGRRLIGMHAGSGTTKNLVLRRWAPEKWADLCRLIAQDENAVILLFGGPDERTLREQIIHKASLSPGRIVEAKTATVLDSAALIARLDGFVCCDTLLTHVAAAMKTPQVVIMGPTPHESVAPWHAPHRIVRTGIPCSPCYGYSRYGIRCTNPVRLQCLMELTAVAVHGALTELLLSENGSNGEIK